MTIRMRRLPLIGIHGTPLTLRLGAKRLPRTAPIGQTDESLASTGVVGVWAGPYTPGTAYNLLHHALGSLDGTGGAWGHVGGGMGPAPQRYRPSTAGARG
jgi:hypothetical protein